MTQFSLRSSRPGSNMRQLLTLGPHFFPLLITVKFKNFKNIILRVNDHGPCPFSVNASGTVQITNVLFLNICRRIKLLVSLPFYITDTLLLTKAQWGK